MWAEITPQVPEFFTTGGFPFWQEPGPFARRLATRGMPFGPGTYKVGYEIAPGHYQASGGRYPNPGESVPAGYSFCTWSRLSSFRGNQASQLEYGNGPQVTITGTDYGFESQTCGTWTKVD